MLKQEGGRSWLRSLQEFNQALLCKQAWYLVTNSHSLLSEMLRARYFRQGTFFEAAGGVRPSYVWRSLLCARPLLEKGLRWFIRSSCSLRLAADPWIPRSVSFQLVVQPLQLDQHVSSLLRLDTSWLEEEVKEVFAAD